MPTDDSLPPFKQDIPDQVLQDLYSQEGGASPTRKWLCESMAETRRDIQWIIKHEKEKTVILDEIKANVIKTNGRVTKLEDQVAKLEADRTDIKKIKEDIKLVVLVKNLTFSKWFWIALSIFLFGLWSLVSNAEFIKALPLLKDIFGG